MSDKKLKLTNKNRRTFLRGIGSLAVGLPIFDFMLNSHGTAFAQGVQLPKRFMTLYQGTGISWQSKHAQSHFVPNKIGSNFDYKMGINELANFPKLKEYMSIVTNQKMPYTVWTDSNLYTGNPGPGGLAGHFHRAATLVQLSGTRIEETGTKKYKARFAQTATSLYADFIKHKSFYTAINATSYKEQNYFKNINHDTKRWTSSIFYGHHFHVDKNGNTPLPENNPRRFYEELVGISKTLNKPSGAEAQAASEIKNKSKSILDFLNQRNVEHLKKNLSKANKQKLDIHFEKIRQMERNLASNEEPQSLSCDLKAKTFNYGNVDHGRGYSDEDRRTDAWAEVLSYAFVCDAYRSGMMQISPGQTHMKLHHYIDGLGSDHNQHNSGHGPRNGPLGIDKFSQYYNWHVKMFSKVAEKLRATPEGNGNLLDNSVMMLISEGGMGASCEKLGSESTHSVENMITLVAGKAGNLKAGVHVDAKGNHASKTLISALNACTDGKINKLGEISGTMPGLQDT